VSFRRAASALRDAPERATGLVGTLAAGSLGVALVIELAGGLVLELGVLHASLRGTTRALAAAAVTVPVFVVLRAFASRREPIVDVLLRALADLAFWTLCVAIVGVWIAFRVEACGGLDSYAYVSAAQALAAGHLRLPAPLAAVLPFEDGLSAAAPLGWMPAPDGLHLQPEFPLGLPLVMAVAIGIAGGDGPFWVSPLFGVVTMLAVYRLARRLGGEPVARLAMVMTAAHPVFVTQAIQPMSDVAATAWLVLSVIALCEPAPSPRAAGMFAGLAVWTRPPLMLPCVVAWLVPAGEGARCVRRRYAASLAACIGALALFQWYLYGDPFTSGRGDAVHVFRVERVAVNLRTYVQWFTYLHTPLVYAVLVAGLWSRRLGRMKWVLLALFVAEAAPYLAYLAFESWETLRYWLPGLPLLALVAASGLVAIVSRTTRGVSGAVQAALVAVLAWGLAAASFVFLRGQPTFDLKQSEARYPFAASLVVLHTAPGDVIVADVHSGSLRLYADRETLRWDAVPPDALEPTVVRLAQSGRRTLVLLDDWIEDRRFRQRFAGALARLETTTAWRARGMTALWLVPK
jgi:hypothetical protein